MFKGMFLTEEDVEEITEQLDRLNIEIGSTMVFCEDKEKVLENMRQASSILYKIQNKLG